jgi:trk system potassium uptake protein TrkA
LLSKSLVLLGEATDMGLLGQEHVEDADGFLAVTHDDETNLMACLLAREMGAKRCVALMHQTQAIDMCKR